MTTTITGLNGEPDIFRTFDFDFDCCHTILTTLMTVLQERFKEEINSEHPILPPQANIVFAVDTMTATQMIEYMTSKLIGVGRFEGGEFRFIAKSSDANGVQRLRLEFNNGVNLNTIERIAKMTDALSKAA